jgi:hypothetical protein
MHSIKIKIWAESGTSLTQTLAWAQIWEHCLNNPFACGEITYTLALTTKGFPEIYPTRTPPPLFWNIGRTHSNLFCLLTTTEPCKLHGSCYATPSMLRLSHTCYFQVCTIKFCFEISCLCFFSLRNSINKEEFRFTANLWLEPSKNLAQRVKFWTEISERHVVCM